jgi:peptide/nickel transport system substrate-binding protein
MAMDADTTAPGRLTRRRALQLLGLSAGAAALAGCAPAAPRSAAPAGGAAGASAPVQPRYGGKLKIARSNDIVTLDPQHFAGDVLGTTYGTVYERLLDYDDELRPRPMLAEAWELSGDALRLQLKLRKGVQWHSGREFTSDDVRFTLTRVRDPKVGGTWVRFANLVEGIDTPDAHTVLLTMKQPTPSILDMFETLNMDDKDAVGDPKKAVGTGPFVFKEWVQGQRVSFVKNPNYWQSGRPYLDEVEVQITNDSQALVVRLENSDVHAINDPLLRDLGRLRQDDRWSMVLTRPGYYYVGINTIKPEKAPQLQDKRVRQALNHAIDRKRFASTMLQGLSEPWNLPWPPYSEAYEPQKQAATAFDLDKAKALLQQAGVSSLDADLIYVSTDFEMAQFSQMYQADLAKIGVKLTVRGVEAAVYAAATNANNADYQMVADASAFAQYQPASLFIFGLQGPFGVMADEPLVPQVAGEADTTKRKQHLAQLNDKILDLAMRNVMGQTQRALVFPKDQVHGLRRAVNQVTMYGDTWLTA